MTFTKIAKAANSFSKSVKSVTEYIIGGFRSYLLKQDSGYLLLQNGGKIIIHIADDGKEAVNYTKVAKPN